jgi:serine/threonine-protein kinase
MSLPIGQVIDGKYRIVRIIGEGGMGAVYEGENTRIRRRVAIKVLHAGVASNTEMVQRFEREAQVAGTVGNDHILEILDLGALPGGERYMVMEYLDGETLTDRIKSRGRLTPSEATVLVKQVLQGLAAAHAAGIVHRDLKPDNIFILKEKAGTRDYVKIIDFGISKFAEQGASSRMTRTGALMGTPHYMAPEQATGSSEIDRRTDIYAVGIILYEAVTGRVPFQAETFNQLLFEIALAKITPASQLVPDLSPGIDSIIMKASARDPAHRFQTCEEFSAALDEWQASGRAVSIPPEQSIEAIVAATVKTAPLPSVSGDSMAGLAPATRSAAPSLSGASGVGIPAGSVAGAASAAAPGQPTLNSWANSQAVVPRSNTPVVVATVLGVLLLGGGALGAYLMLRPGDTSAAAPGVSAAPSAEPVPVAATVEPAPVAPAASAPAPASSVEPPEAVPVAAAPAPAAAPPPRPITAKPRPPAKSAAAPVKAPPEPEKPASKPKKPISFGY